MTRPCTSGTLGVLIFHRHHTIHIEMCSQQCCGTSTPQTQSSLLPRYVSFIFDHASVHRAYSSHHRCVFVTSILAMAILIVLMITMDCADVAGVRTEASSGLGSALHCILRGMLRCGPQASGSVPVERCVSSRRFEASVLTHTRQTHMWPASTRPSTSLSPLHMQAFYTCSIILPPRT